MIVLQGPSMRTPFFVSFKFLIYVNEIYRKIHVGIK
jgi:hypothetical protein